MTPTRLFDLVYNQLNDYPTDQMFVTKRNGKWEAISTKEFVEQTKLVSRGLIALKFKQMIVLLLFLQSCGVEYYGYCLFSK
ncbi:MAG: hypothetical protein R2779_08075 [Crocinitomicaceae bacterium]